MLFRSPAPEPVPVDDDVAALLDAAEDIVNSAAPDILAEMDKREKASRLFDRRRLGKAPNKKKRKKK